MYILLNIDPISWISINILRFGVVAVSKSVYSKAIFSGSMLLRLPPLPVHQLEFSSRRICSKYKS